MYPIGYKRFRLVGVPTFLPTYYFVFLVLCSGFFFGIFVRVAEFYSLNIISDAIRFHTSVFILAFLSLMSIYI